MLPHFTRMVRVSSRRRGRPLIRTIPTLMVATQIPSRPAINTGTGPNTAGRNPTGATPGRRFAFVSRYHHETIFLLELWFVRSSNGDHHDIVLQQQRQWHPYPSQTDTNTRYIRHLHLNSNFF